MIDEFGFDLRIDDDTKIRALLILRKFIRKEKFYNRPFRLTLLAVLYLASRERNIPVTISDFADISREDRDSIQSIAIRIMRRLALTIPPSDHIEILSRYCRESNLELDLINRMILFTQTLLDQSSEILLDAKPEDFASAAIAFFSSSQEFVEFSPEKPSSSESEVKRIYDLVHNSFKFLKDENLVNLSSNQIEEKTLSILDKKTDICERFKPIVYVKTPACFMCQYQRNAEVCPRIAGSAKL